MKTKTGLYIIVFIFIPLSIFSQGWVFQNISAGNSSLNGIHTISPRTCIIAGGYIQDLSTNIFTVYRTTNKGVNWSSVSSGSGYYFTCVQFPDSLTGYAGGGAYFIMPEMETGKCVYKTTNGGANWNPVFQWLMLGSTYIDIKDIHFINAQTGWACALDGTIIKTTNSGTNFISQVAPALYKKYSIFFINDLTGWVCGENGNISKTTNGGTNWFSVSLTSAVQLNSIYFTNAGTGYVCGNGGFIYKTTNGGANWTMRPSISTADMNSVYFYNADKGWVAGINVVLGTSNGGANWTQQFMGTASLSSLHFFDSINGWACGGNKILGTVSGGWTGVVRQGNLIPSETRLIQNYPNPFNSMTNVKFQISKTEVRSLKLEVRITLYDISGKETAILVNEQKPPGEYELMFDGGDLPGGVYYYVLYADGVRMDTKKMVLIK